MKNKRKYVLGGIVIGILLLIVTLLTLQLRQNQNNVIPEGEPAIETPISPDVGSPSGEVIETPPVIDDSLLTNKVTLFTADTDTYDKKKIESIEIEPSLSIEDKLQVIANELSNKQFDSLAIEIHKIEEIEGKKIAIINLKDDPTAKNEKTWMDYLNAGSTGSTITKVTLEESFLQSNLPGEWIDGMKLIYEGEEIPEMDHFPGTQVVYRKQQ